MTNMFTAGEGKTDDNKSNNFSDFWDGFWNCDIDKPGLNTNVRIPGNSGFFSPNRDSNELICRTDFPYQFDLNNSLLSPDLKITHSMINCGKGSFQLNESEESKSLYELKSLISEEKEVSLFHIKPLCSTRSKNDKIVSMLDTIDIKNSSSKQTSQISKDTSRKAIFRALKRFYINIFK